MKDKLDSLKQNLFDPAAKNPKLRIVFLIINMIYVLLSLLVMVMGGVISVQVKSYNYLPPVLAAAGLFLLFTVPFGLYGIYYKSADPSRRFIAIQLYLFLALFLSLLLILLGGFFIVFHPSLKYKIMMRWDVFVDDINPDHNCAENEKSVDKFCGFLKTGAAFSVLAGVVLLAAPLIGIFLVGWRLYINSLYLIGSCLMIISGIFMSAVGIYLLMTYAKPGEVSTRFMLPKTAPAIYMMIGCGVLPVVVGLFGIGLGFQKKTPSRSVMFIFELGLVFSIALLFATGGYFINMYTKTALVEIRTYMGKNTAWVSQAMTLRRCFLNTDSCALNECNGQVTDDEEIATYTQWIEDGFSARIKADFFLCGFTGVAVGIFALLMAVSIAIELLIHFYKTWGMTDEEEEQYDEEQDYDDEDYEGDDGEYEEGPEERAGVN